MHNLLYGALLVLIGLAVVHLFGGKLRFMNVVPRSRWLSFAGGISVAYTFIHLLPELSAHEKVLERATAHGSFSFLNHHAYLIALLGLVFFYGVERHTRESREQHKKETGEDRTSKGGFWLSMGSFAIYNALVGYLLMRQADLTIRGLIFFAIAMALHFLVNDYGLREHHKDLYTHIGRFVVAAAVLAGGVLGIFWEIAETTVAILVAFLAGGIILNVMKEELPQEQNSKFWAFAAGAGMYAVLLLFL